MWVLQLSDGNYFVGRLYNYKLKWNVIVEITALTATINLEFNSGEGCYWRQSHFNSYLLYI